MGKYDPLEAHLRRQKAATYDMTFRDIERILGVLLPKRALRPEWWGNEPGLDIGQVQRRAWLNARYKAALLKSGECVRFTRIPA
ncbi:MAG: hypothetical protein U1C74_14570 [Phenylobacterium sp.]|nr:hypothetical protein [Phenylobacterium sp.]